MAGPGRIVAKYQVGMCNKEVSLIQAKVLIAMLLLAAVFFWRKRKRYTLEVRIEPESAASISDISYTKGHGCVVAEFTIDIKEGYVLKTWTGTLPRLEGYDPARWYDSEKNMVRLEINRNEKLRLHFDHRP